MGDVKRTLAHTTAEHAQTEGTRARTAVLERDARGSVVENWEMVKVRANGPVSGGGERGGVRGAEQVAGLL